MARLGVEDDVPIEAGLVNKAIENAQTKVEGYNFDIRKHVLHYDEVVNEQRNRIYDERRRILTEPSLKLTIESMIEDEVNDLVRPVHGRRVRRHTGSSTTWPRRSRRWCTAARRLHARALGGHEARRYRGGRRRAGARGLRGQGRLSWASRLHAPGREADHALGRRQPLDPPPDRPRPPARRHRPPGHRQGRPAGRLQARGVPHVRRADGRHPQRHRQGRSSACRSDSTGAARQAQAAARKGSPGRQDSRRALAHGAQHPHRIAMPTRPQTVRKSGPQLGRNDPCWCGSGKKYKNCHMQSDQAQGTGAQRVAAK